MQVENSKGECNFGQHEINFHYDDALRDRRRPRDLQERRQGDRRPGGATRSPSWPSSTSARATRATSTARSPTRTASNVFADDRAAVRPLHRRPARLHARADAVLRAAHQLLQALRAGLVRADRGRLGQGQPHLLAARRRPRRGRCGSRTGCPGADVNPYLALAAMIAAGPARDRQRAARSSRRFEGNAYESDKPHVPHNIYDARDLFAASEVAREAFGAGGRRPLPEPRPDRARGVRGGGHRLGALPGLRAAVSAAAGRSASAPRSSGSRWGVWDGTRRTLAPRTYSRRGRSAAGGDRDRCCRPTRRVAEAPDAAARPLDALILAGGADIDPACYGAEPHPRRRGTWPERDRFELALARRALERDLPVLGICRGMQLLNVARGGTLDQHLPERSARRPPAHAGRVRRPRGAARAGLARRRARPAPSGSRSRSHHHQGVDELGEGLVASGWSAPDEIVEAIELPGRGASRSASSGTPRRTRASPVIAALVEAARDAEWRVSA